MRTINENYKAYQLKAPAAVTATANTTGVAVGDGMLDDAIVIINIGAVSGTTPTLDIAVQTSDAVGGTYTTVGSFAQKAAADANTVCAIQLNLDGPNSGDEEQKFVRLAQTVAGTTPSFTYGAVMLVKAETGKTDLNND